MKKYDVEWHELTRATKIDFVFTCICLALLIMCSILMQLGILNNDIAVIILGFAVGVGFITSTIMTFCRY